MSLNFSDPIQHPEPDAHTEFLWLLQQCQDGDPQAIQEIVKRFVPDVYAVCLAIVGETQEAADCAADALAHSLANLGQFGGQVDFRVWLLRKTVAEARRKRRLHLPRPETDALTDFLKIPELPRLCLTFSDGLGLNLADITQILNVRAEIAEQAVQAGRNLLDQRVPLVQLLSRGEWNNETKGTQVAATLERLDAQHADRRLGSRLREFTWGGLALLVLVLMGWLVNQLSEQARSRDPIVINLAGSATPEFLQPRPRIRTTFFTSPPMVRLDGESYAPVVSADGRSVAFVSTASNLVEVDSNGYADIFTYDRITGDVERVSLGAGFSQADGDSAAPSISANGRFVAFVSWAGNLVEDDIDICQDNSLRGLSCADVFVYDRQRELIHLASTFDGQSGLGHSGISFQGGQLLAKTAISSDGQQVVFYAAVHNQGYAAEAGGIFLHNLANQTTQRIDLRSDGSAPGAPPLDFTFSADGNWLAFTSQADNLDGVSLFAQVFLVDLNSKAVWRISRGLDDQGANQDVSQPVLSADGRYLAYSTSANNLVPGDRNEQPDIFIYDRQTGLTRIVPLLPGGIQGTQVSQETSFSADGQWLAFASLAGNLASGDGNFAWDVYLLDLETDELEWVSHLAGGLAGAGFSRSPSISGDGRFIAFVSSTANFVRNDTNGFADVFFLDREYDRILRISAARYSHNPLPTATPTIALPEGTPTELVSPVATVTGASPTSVPTSVASPTQAVQYPTPETGYPPPIVFPTITPYPEP